RAAQLSVRALPRDLGEVPGDGVELPVDRMSPIQGRVEEFRRGDFTVADELGEGDRVVLAVVQVFHGSLLLITAVGEPSGGTRNREAFRTSFLDERCEPDGNEPDRK